MSARVASKNELLLLVARTDFVMRTTSLRKSQLIVCLFVDISIAEQVDTAAAAMTALSQSAAVPANVRVELFVIGFFLPTTLLLTAAFRDQDTVIHDAPNRGTTPRNGFLKRNLQSMLIANPRTSRTCEKAQRILGKSFEMRSQNQPKLRRPKPHGVKEYILSS